MYAFAPNGQPIVGTPERTTARPDIAADSFVLRDDGLDFEPEGGCAPCATS